MVESSNVVQMPGTSRAPLESISIVRPAPQPAPNGDAYEAPRVMTSTAEDDIKRHLASLEAFKDPAVAVALSDRFQKAVVLAGLAFLGAFVIVVVALLAVTLGYLLGGMR